MDPSAPLAASSYVVAPRPADEGSRPASGIAIPARFVVPALVAMLVLLLWQVLVSAFHVPAVVLPTPLEIMAVFGRAGPLLLKNAVPTTVDVVTGFAIATAAGIGLSVLMAASRVLREAIYPSVLFFQLIPKIALAPLFILWFGIGSSSRLAFIVFICFFPTVLAATTGLLSTPPAMIKLCEACSARRLDVLLRVRFPQAVPMIFSGLKISVTFAIVGVVVGEFISSQAGLGYMVLFASSQADTALALAAIVLLCVIGLALYGAVVWAERLALQRFGETRS